MPKAIKVTKSHIRKVIKKGNWMVRADDDGFSHGGFKWNGVGEWTEAPDWTKEECCGGGLHGQDKDNGGFICGSRLVFCETHGKHIPIGGDKIKVKKARILVVGGLPDGICFNGSLDLEGTGITSLPENLSVGGSLDLEGTGITSLPENLSVGGWLDLEGTGITSLPENLSVGGWLDLRGTGITSLPENLSVGGWLNLRGTGITSLPENLSVGGWLDLEGTGITSLPKTLNVKSYIYKDF